MDPVAGGSGDRAVAAAAERAKTTAARNIPSFSDLPAPADTANLREGANLNDALLALLPLVGVWRGKGEGRGSEGDYRFGQQIVVSHDGGDYLIWEARSWRLTASGDYEQNGLRESGFWRFVDDPTDPNESQAIELLLANSAGYVELFYGQPLNQSSWELVTDALARSKSGMLVGGAKRLYGIVEGGDLAYVEERVDADGGLIPHLSARLMRKVWLATALAAATIAAGCSSNNAPSEESSTPSPSGHGAYAKCLHDHGISAPPGPVAGPPPGSDEATWHKAMQDCALMAPGPDAG